MNNARVQSTPPPKKGLHPMVWVGIGCAGIALVAIVAVVAGGIFAVNKARDIAAELEDNPAPTLAKMLAAANPDIEFVAEDSASGTVTFLNTRTNEEITVSYADIEDGAISFSKDGGDSAGDGAGRNDVTATLDLGASEDGQARMSITTDSGTTSLETGTGAENLPAWVPVYPGTVPEGTLSTDTPESRGGVYTAKTSDEMEDVLDYYADELEASGFTIESRTRMPEGGMLNAEDEGGRNVTLILGTTKGPTEIVVQYAQSP